VLPKFKSQVTNIMIIELTKLSQVLQNAGGNNWQNKRNKMEVMIISLTKRKTGVTDRSTQTAEYEPQISNNPVSSELLE